VKGEEHSLFPFVYSLLDPDFNFEKAEEQEE
jgi:SMC interacting uncharacterized protein involved in chromosome segregation